MNTYRKSMDIARKAASTAIDRSIKTVGGESDEDLRIYSKLKPEHFEIMIQKGIMTTDQVNEYVLAMEARKMKRNGRSS